MNKFRRAVMWAGLVLIILLIFLSIYGAFIGAERAEKFFNCLPLAVYWATLGFLLIIALAAFRRLIRVPGLLLMHAGCVLILAGAMLGSQFGHEFRKKLSGTDKIRKGRMVIHEGERENKVTMEDGNQIKELPFSIQLKDFRLEYYEPVHLQIQTRQGQNWRIPVKVGREFPLGDDFGTIKIVRTFENFKIGMEDGKSVPFDDPKPGSNPALEVQITQPDGQVATQYVFELFPGHSHSQNKLMLSYHRTISDYISELQIIEDDKVVAEKDIEVNHPLHFGGYHFYQSSYDAKAG
ncbi:MAG: cytochrome c biogenesis protein ResB, partial [Planctomycetota bacterium]